MPKAPPPTTDAAIARKIHTAVTDTFPTATRNPRLTEYYVVAPSLRFFKVNARGTYVPQTASDRREGDASRARRGDVFTGSLLFTEKQAYVDLGFNTFLPLTDVRSGAVLLRTSRWRGEGGRKRKRWAR
jgi:hypothetical protein